MPKSQAFASPVATAVFRHAGDGHSSGRAELSARRMHAGAQGSPLQVTRSDEDPLREVMVSRVVVSAVVLGVLVGGSWLAL
jgi:hypothetical protein